MITLIFEAAVIVARVPWVTSLPDNSATTKVEPFREEEEVKRDEARARDKERLANIS